MKLQPNFSWQKYEGKPEDQKEQFQYQLQSQHLLVANSINSTINDISYLLQERPTAFTWVTGQPIFTQTYATQAWTAVGTVNTIQLNITGGKTGNFTVIDMKGFISTDLLDTGTTLILPNLDIAVAANEIQIQRIANTVVLTSGGTDYSAYSGYVTVYYVKS